MKRRKRKLVDISSTQESIEKDTEPNENVCELWFDCAKSSQWIWCWLVVDRSIFRDIRLICREWLLMAKMTQLWRSFFEAQTLRISETTQCDLLILILDIIPAEILKQWHKHCHREDKMVFKCRMRSIWRYYSHLLIAVDASQLSWFTRQIIIN